MINIIDAILALNPKALVKVTSEDYAKIEWLHGTEPISVDNIKTKFNELQSAYDAQAYARNRKAEYPDWGTQLNKIYDDGVTKWKSEMVDPVKAKWPKDNSGPVE